MPRLFTAISLPHDVSDQLSLLRAGMPGAHWIDPENYHITLNYLGAVDGNQADDLIDALAQLEHDEFSLRITGLDCFGSSKPRTIYARIKPDEALLRLQQSIARLISVLGLSQDKRAFLPHVTLARLKDVVPYEAAAWLAGRGGLVSRHFDVKRFGVYSSRISKGGGPYILESSYDLGYDDHEQYANW